MKLNLPLTFKKISGCPSTFPYPKEILGGPTYLIAKHDSGNYYKLKGPGNDGIWVPKADVVKDFKLMLAQFEKKSEYVYPDIKKDLPFVVGRQPDGTILVLFQEGSKCLFGAIPESIYKKDFKLISVDLSTIVDFVAARPEFIAAPLATPVAAPLATPVAAPSAASVVATPVAAPVAAHAAAPVVAAPVAAPLATSVAAPVAAPLATSVAAPAAPLARRGRPRKFAEKRKHSALRNILTDEEVVADSLFASAAKIYKRIKATNKELVAEVGRLNARIEVLQAEIAKRN